MKAPSVLCVGLTAQSKHIPDGAYDRELLAELLHEGEVKATAAGFDFKAVYCEPEDSHLFEKELKENHWDAVIIGFGVRGQAKMTPHFEKLVNLVREHDATIKMGFNSSPTDSVDACQRLFPNIKPIAV